MPRDADHLLVSGGQMAQLEQQLFASGLPVEALMEKAALLVARHLLEHEPLQAGALVLVGPGHNGGDALVVARELHLAGVAVRIWSPYERHKPLTAAHLGHGLNDQHTRHQGATGEMALKLRFIEGDVLDRHSAFTRLMLNHPIH